MGLEVFGEWGVGFIGLGVWVHSPQGLVSRIWVCGVGGFRGLGRFQGLGHLHYVRGHDFAMV